MTKKLIYVKLIIGEVMEYSYFTKEQIMREFNNYQELCDLFFDLATDNETKEKLAHILYEGGYKGFSFSSKIVSKDNPYIEIKRRASLAYLLIRNPETFDNLVENRVNLFHGTKSNALPSILKNGLNSVDELKKYGIIVKTGEEWSRIQGERSFISFTDVLDIAEEYSYFASKDKNNDLSFEIVIGTTLNDVMASKRCRVSSDIPEVAIKDKFPKENIKCVLVPSNVMDIVNKFIDNSGIEVLSMDGIDEKFYYIDDFGIDISYELFDNLKKDIQSKKRQ